MLILKLQDADFFLCSSGLLCTFAGVLVLILNCAVPEKVKEVLGVGGTDDEDGEGHLSSVFLEDLNISQVASKARLVSWANLCGENPFPPVRHLHRPHPVFRSICDACP